MKKFIIGATLALLLGAGSAFAYNIKHSYSAANNATEFHGSCANGAKIMILASSNGNFDYEGPAGKGSTSNGLDAAAKLACGEK